MTNNLNTADTAVAFSVEGRFVASGADFGGRDKDLNSYMDGERISDRAKRPQLDYYGSTFFGVNNLFHRRSMRVSGLPIFVSSLAAYKIYPTYEMRTFISEANSSTALLPSNMSSGEIFSANGETLIMAIHLSTQDWEDFKTVGISKDGVRFQLWFSEEIQKALGSLDGMNYHIKSDIERISKTLDRGDGAARGNSFQTVDEFDIVHTGNIQTERIVFFTKLKSLAN